MSVTIKWEERLECEYTFLTVADAIEFVNDNSAEEEQLPADASRSDVIAALEGLDLPNDVADLEADTAVYRDDFEVS